MKFVCEPVRAEMAEAATEHVVLRYAEERKRTPILPEADFAPILRKSIERLFARGTGIAAIEEGKLIGYLAGFRIDHLHGAGAGFYCPLFGHALGTFEIGLARELYRRASQLWVDQRAHTHALTIFAHETALNDYLFRQGFGMRCVDAMKQVEPNPRLDPSVRVKHTGPEDYARLVELHQKHQAYYRQAPMFMLNRDIDPFQEQIDWAAKENHHEWAAWRGERPIGILRLCPSGESFVTEHPRVMNVKATFVEERERGTGVGAQLLGAAQEWMARTGYDLCGVDFESINPSAADFWLKRFAPYTYSLVRRIDDRP